MTTYTIHLIGPPGRESQSIELSGVPRVGDELRLDSTNYGVRRVIWDADSKAGPLVWVCITRLDDTGTPIPNARNA
jgi:hypothetical protein